MSAAYYYRVRWGFQQEFERLFFKNHYPVLKAQMATGGRIKAVSVVPPAPSTATAAPTGRLRVAITFKDTAAIGTGPSDREDAIVKRLYPDQAALTKAEEQRRFEILDAHWDVPLNELEPPK